ncbi:MAG: hypothetical protein K6E17_08920 [Clostridiales bacterium]|nr:hypothetical protein [Clostridiales bacterium]
MTIVSHVCVEFHNAKGEPIFAVTPSTVNTLITDVPDEICSDPLYQMMINDGSLSAGISKEKARQLENDPTLGIDASGKAIPPEPAEPAPAESTESEPAKRTRKTTDK